MTPFSRPRPSTIAAAIGLAAAAVTTGCSSVDEFLTGDKVDYRSGSGKTDPLEVPPDLTQLARDSRYRPQSGVVSASTATAAPVSATPAAASLVAPSAVGNVRMMREGQQRWLVVPTSPEVLWPQLRSFWAERGFTLDVDSPDAGVLETGWAENRAKIQNDWLRSTLGKLVEGAWQTGTRDRFRTRVERGANGTEIFISHRGVEEVLVSPNIRNIDERTIWQNRPNDPQLEAEFLARLMVKLGTTEPAARAAVAEAAPVPVAAPKARALGPESPSSLEVDDGFDRAWRRVGVALDRTGFTVEDRDRAAGIYFVRYVDPASALVDDPGFFAKIFSRDAKASSTPVRLRVLVKGDTQRSVVTVQNSQGAPETGESGKRIVNALVAELK